jgi:hypothetical protein
MHVDHFPAYVHYSFLRASPFHVLHFQRCPAEVLIAIFPPAIVASRFGVVIDGAGPKARAVLLWLRELHACLRANVSILRLRANVWTACGPAALAS